jgi:hypothetical protein
MEAKLVEILVAKQEMVGKRKRPVSLTSLGFIPIEE